MPKADLDDAGLSPEQAVAPGAGRPSAPPVGNVAAPAASDMPPIISGQTRDDRVSTISPLASDPPILTWEAVGPILILLLLVAGLLYAQTNGYISLGKPRDQRAAAAAPSKDKPPSQSAAPAPTAPAPVPTPAPKPPIVRPAIPTTAPPRPQAAPPASAPAEAASTKHSLRIVRDLQREVRRLRERVKHLEQPWWKRL